MMFVLFVVFCIVTLVATAFLIAVYFDAASNVLRFPSSELSNYNKTGLERLIYRLAVETFRVRVVHNAVRDMYALEVCAFMVRWRRVRGTYDNGREYNTEAAAERDAQGLIAQAHKWIEQSKKSQRTTVKQFSVQATKTKETE